MNGSSKPGLLRSIDADGGSCEFLQVDRMTLARIPFHDHRLVVEGRSRLSAAEAAALARAQQRPHLNYIFHTAFCGSTLLARGLDIPGRVFSIREPEVLMDLANHLRMGRSGMADVGPRRETLELAARLLAAGAEPGEQVVVKPTNAVNNLIGDVLALPSTHATLLLYSDLRSFLVSVIKKGERCRAFVRQLFNVLMLDTRAFAGIPERQRLLFTDLQVAAIVWYVQMRNYLAVIEASRDARIRTLDSARFFAAPRETLPRVAEFFRLELDASQVETILASGVFERDSKDPDIAYDSRVRRDESARVESAYADALDTIIDWAGELQRQMQVTIPPNLPLAIDG